MKLVYVWKGSTPSYNSCFWCYNEVVIFVALHYRYYPLPRAFIRLFCFDLHRTNYKTYSCLNVYSGNNKNVFFVVRRKLSATQTSNPQIVQIHIPQTLWSISLKLNISKINSSYIIWSKYKIYKKFWSSEQKI